MRNIANRLMLMPLVALIMMAIGLPALAPVTAHAAEYNGVPTVYVSDVEGTVGDVVDVNISLANNPGITGMQLLIYYDESALQLDAILNDQTGLHGAVHMPWPCTPASISQGCRYEFPRRLQWSDYLAWSDNEYNGVIATLQFTILSPEGSKVSIEYPSAENNDGELIIDYPLNAVGNDVVFGLIPGFVGSANKNTYTVTFDADNGTNPWTATVKEGETVTEPSVPEKGGNTFLGWFIGNEKFDFDTPITADITLTARWEWIEPVVLERIAVTSMPDKTVYTVGDSLDLYGLEITAYFSDETFSVVDEYTTKPIDGSILDTVGPVTVAVSYTVDDVTRTTSFTVTVNDILEEFVFVTGIHTDFQIGLAYDEFKWIYEPESGAEEVGFEVTGEEGPFKLWLGIEGVYPGIWIEGIKANDTYDVSEYFYDVEVPKGVSNVTISVWPHEADYISNDSSSEAIALLETGADAKLFFEYNGETYEIDFVLDGNNPFPELGGGEVTLVSAVPTASVNKANGNKNDLTITVIETYSDGSTNKITTTISINNNSAGSYLVGSYIVYVDTKGNDQIRRCYIVN